MSDDNRSSKTEQIEALRAEIEKKGERAAWCWDQEEGLSRSIDDACRDDYYWDTKDLMRERRREAVELSDEIEALKKKLAALEKT